jgi:N utilization substance protein B
MMATSSRRRSRIAAFQALFEADISGRPPLEVLDRHLEESPLSPSGAAFAHELVGGVARERDTIDDVIRRYAPAFPLADMAPVDRNVLRLAIYEVLFDNRRAPLRVAINEAVEIAKGYGSESSGRFVNGVLGAVALQAAEDDGTEQGDSGPPDASADADP